MEGPMTKSNDNSEDDELGRFFGNSPTHTLVGGIFYETTDQLYSASRRLTKLYHFVAGAMEDDEVECHQSKEETDRIRQWQLTQLKYVNRKLSRLIGDTLQIKLSIVDVIERLKMAELERSAESELQKFKLELLNGGKTEPRLRPGKERADDKSNTPTRIEGESADWDAVEEP
jgi:hypothetical protein